MQFRRFYCRTPHHSPSVPAMEGVPMPYPKGGSTGDVIADSATTLAHNGPQSPRTVHLPIRASDRAPSVGFASSTVPCHVRKRLPSARNVDVPHVHHTGRISHQARLDRLEEAETATQRNILYVLASLLQAGERWL